MKKILMTAVAAALACTAYSAHADVFSDMASKNMSSYNALKKGKSQEERSQIDRDAAQHADPVIRALAYNSVTRNYASETDELKFFTAQLKKEQDPQVLAAGLRSLMNNLKVSADLYAIFKQSITHENVDVRKGALMGLANVNNKSVAGIEDEAVKFLDDKDEGVRVNACRDLARANNGKAIARIEQLIKANDPAAAKMLGGCATGLVTLWYNGPFFDKFDAKAYQLTLDYLKLTPRSKDQPSWSILSALKKTPKPAWVNLSKDVYKPADVVAVLSDIAKDKAAPKMAREYAVEAIAFHGTKADLEALAPALEGDPVAKKIERAMKQAK